MVMLAGLVLIASCADTGEPLVGLPAPNSGTTIASSTLVGAVVEVWVLPYPEGSNVVAYREPPPHDKGPYSGPRFIAFAKRLGWPLPEPLEQPRRCTRGERNYTVSIVLDSGQTQSFGPCKRPAIVDLAVQELNAGF